MSGNIQIYAELLHNIRAISLVITLQSLSNTETKALISADGQSITVAHEGEVASICLPNQMAGGGTTTLPLPAAPSKNLTLRVQLQEKEPGLLRLEETNGGNEVPWSAVALSNATIVCKSCRAVLLDAVKVKDWRDLPNDNWAEMMDLWHCHKPHEEDDDKTGLGSKGYAATNQLAVNSGTGFVSLLYFLLAEQDCHNIEVTSTGISCHLCKHVLGSIDRTTNAIKFSKWALAVENRAYIEDHPTEKWFAAQVLAAIDSEGSRRFMVELSDTTNDPDLKAILCWVFTDDLNFSSSAQSGIRENPTRAMKILWKNVADPEESLKDGHMTVEHILLPSAVFTEIVDALKISAELMPVTIRTFQDWKVGLLRRFRVADSKRIG